MKHRVLNFALQGLSISSKCTFRGLSMVLSNALTSCIQNAAYLKQLVDNMSQYVLLSHLVYSVTYCMTG